MYDYDQNDDDGEKIWFFRKMIIMIQTKGIEMIKTMMLMIMRDDKGAASLWGQGQSFHLKKLLVVTWF